MWNGKERRSTIDSECKWGNKVPNMSDSVIRIEGSLASLDLRINGSLEKMASHVEDSIYWRRFIVGTAISLVIAILGGIFTASTIAYTFGEYTRQIRVNTFRLDKLESSHDNLKHKETA